MPEQTKLESATWPVSELSAQLGLSEDETKWLRIFDDAIDEYSRVISWHLSRKLKMKTARVNYHLAKLVKKGVLKKEISRGACTIYTRPA